MEWSKTPPTSTTTSQSPSTAGSRVLKRGNNASAKKGGIHLIQFKPDNRKVAEIAEAFKHEAGQGLVAVEFAVVSSDLAWHCFECGYLQKRPTALQERTKYTTYCPETESEKKTDSEHGRHE